MRLSLLVVGVHGLCSAFVKFIAFIAKLFFGSRDFNYSGVQRGQSVSTFYLSRFHFVGLISSLVVLPFPAVVFLSYPIIVRLCPFMSLRLDILLVF